MSVGAGTVVVMNGVHGQDSAGADGRPLGKLHGVSLSLGAELLVVEGGAADGTAALCELLSGKRAVGRGNLRVAGGQPHRQAALRRRIGALLPSAALPSLRLSAGQFLEQASAATAVGALLERLALAGLAERSLASLGPPEQRALELALCLALPQPRLLVLFEPLATLCDGLALGELLRERADAGCAVLVTSRARDPLHHAEHRLVLERGELRERPARETSGIWVQLAQPEAARRLARELAANPALLALDMQLDEHGATLVLRGDPLEPLCRAVTEVVAAERLPLLQLQPLGAAVLPEGRNG